MKELTYDGQVYTCREGETALEALLRHGVGVNYSCKNGVCNGCMCKADQPSNALFTGALAQDLIGKGYFLPCRTSPFTGLSFGPPQSGDITVTAAVVEKTLVAPTILRLLLEPYRNMSWEAGQFVHLFHPDGAWRAYSIASTPDDTPYIELHIRVIARGKVSSWLASEVEEGSELTISQAMGNSFLRADMENLHLIAFGVGLSSVMGIAREALYQNQVGCNRKIRLTHVVKRPADLYLQAELETLAQMHPELAVQFLVEPELTSPVVDRLAGAVMTASGMGISPHVFLCGNPEQVGTLQSVLVGWGFSRLRIVSDPFERHPGDDASDGRPLPGEAGTASPSDGYGIGEERPWPAPCEPLWQRLQAGGDLLKTIIDDFYDAIFEDEIMAPYFQKFTKQRSKEKVYSFYKQLFTGEKCYFGDRPRNAHHWMVIPNEVYDHRLRLLLGFMRKHGLSEEMVALWLPYEEYYRTDIVKTAPRGRKVGDIYQPAGGFDYETLDEGSVCDACEEFVDKGTRVMFHLRTGQIYCPACHDKAAVADA